MAAVCVCVFHIDISDIIRRLKFFIEEGFLPDKKNQLFPICKANAYAYGLL